MIFTDSDKVAARYKGDVSAEDLVWIDSQVSAATDILVALIPRLGDLIVSEKDARLAATAIENAVLRVMRNPGGFKSHTTGPFQGVRFDSAGDGDLFFKPEELAWFRIRKARFGNIGVSMPRYAP